jgi:formylglycine-generating enzyme required for sulfatase activity
MKDGFCPVCGYPCVETAQICSVCGWDLLPVLVGSPEEYEARLVAPRSAWREKIARGQAWAFGAAPPGKGSATLAAPAMKEYTNSIGMEFVLIPAGTFMMGSNDGCDDEEPVHQVTISRPFYLGKYPVTQEEWRIVMGDDPSDFEGPRRPVGNVSWDDVQAFIGRLNREEGHARYRLPTEAEWEYACRAGSTGDYCFGNFVSRLDDYGWYRRNSGAETHPVGEKAPNAWGLYDMHGNVLEWVQDWYGAYPGKSLTDPVGLQGGAAGFVVAHIWKSLTDPAGLPGGGSHRLVRGGSWCDYAAYCRAAFRYYCGLGFRDVFLGFRLALSPGHP